MSFLPTPKTPSKKRPTSALSNSSSPGFQAQVTPVDSEITTISHFGDLVLDISREGTNEHVLAKVDGSRLSQVSKYFRSLLDPNGYLEGKSVVTQRERLKETYANASDILIEDLPRVKITDIGQTSTLKSIRPLVIDFLRILHGYEVQRAVKNPPPVNIANLAVLADRFDTKDSVGSWAVSKANVLPKIHASLPVYDEEIYRQRLLSCLFLGNEIRLVTYSSHLALQGSVMWNETPQEKHKALWWDLPRGIEEELQSRRSYILDAILSLQDYLLGLYTARSKTLQCKLGYDSSPQCDSFQLGEFVKFLTRLGTLKLHGSLIDEDQAEVITGDIRTLIKDMRACPSYQIDPNHAHCGPKKQLAAGLTIIEDRLGEPNVGICYKCWHVPELEHFWSSAKRPPFYNSASSAGYRVVSAGTCERSHIHENTKAFFMAVDRGWPTLLYGRA